MAKTARRTTRQAVGLRVLALGVLIGLCLGPALSAVQNWRTQRVVTGIAFDPFGSASLEGQPGVDVGRTEFGEAFGNLTMTPYVGYSLPDYEGSVLNISDRMRHSYGQPGIGDDPDDALDVWFFGGSALFGFAMQRDEYTIPSQFARIAEEAGVAVRVRNYASMAYVNYQETLLLMTLLEIEEPPDLVVFYDGYNDKGLQVPGTSGLLGTPGEPSYMFFDAFASAIAETRQAELVTPGALSAGRRSPHVDGTAQVDTGQPGTALPDVDLDPAQSAAAVDNLIDIYGQGIDLSRRLGESYGFDVAHFWHPDIYTKRLDPAEVNLVAETGLTDFRLEVWSSLSDRIALSLPDGVIDVSRELDELDGPILSTFTHINERGAAHMAGVLYQELGELPDGPFSTNAP